MDTNTYQLNSTKDRLSLKITNRAIYSHSNKSRPKVPILKEVVTDLVNFLVYIAEPTKNIRQSLGRKVCGFLLLLTCFVYFLKNQIWKKYKN